MATSTPLYIDDENPVTEEMVQEANRLENNPQMMLALIDLLFIEKENDIPS